MGPSWGKGNCIEVYLADLEELFGLNIFVLKALYPCLLPFNLVTKSNCQLT